MKKVKDMIDWHEDCFTVGPFQKRESGRKLIEIVNAAFVSAGYKTTLDHDIHKSLDPRHISYSSTVENLSKYSTGEVHLVGHKHREITPEPIFSGRWRYLYTFPVIGWLLYLRERTTAQLQDTYIKLTLEVEKDYGQISIDISRDEHFVGIKPSEYHVPIDKNTIKIHPRLAEDLKAVENGITKRL